MITRLASLSIGARLTAVTGRCRYGEARLSRPIIGQRVPPPLFQKEIGMTTIAERATQAKAKEYARRARRRQLEPGECVSCDREREDNNKFFPPHDASPNCESGSRCHCTSDTCF